MRLLRNASDLLLVAFATVSVAVWLGYFPSTPVDVVVLGDSTMMLSDWKDLFEVIKLILESSAIIAGGIWAAYTFGSLRQIAKARAEIANTDAARRKTEAELEALGERAKVGAVIEIDFTTTTSKVPNASLIYVSILAEVSNKGNRNAQIEYPEQPFRVYAVSVLETGKLSHTLLQAASVISSVDPTRKSLKLLVRAGGRERLPFLVAVPAPGVYLLVLSLPLPEAEQEIAKQYGFVSKGRWSAKRYVVVPAA